MLFRSKVAGVASVLCKYPPNSKGTNDFYPKLVAISHWTEKDFQREKEVKQICQNNNIRPDYVVDSFEQLIGIISACNGMDL